MNGSCASGAPVEVTGDGGGVLVVEEPTRGEHLRQHRWPPRHHDQAGAGGYQDQAPAAPRVLKGELLGQGPSPRQTEDVHGLPTEAELIQEASQHGGKIGKPVGQR